MKKRMIAVALALASLVLAPATVASAQDIKEMKEFVGTGFLNVDAFDKAKEQWVKYQREARMSCTVDKITDRTLIFARAEFTFHATCFPAGTVTNQTFTAIAYDRGTALAQARSVMRASMSNRFHLCTENSHTVEREPIAEKEIFGATVYAFCS